LTGRRAAETIGEQLNRPSGIRYEAMTNTETKYKVQSLERGLSMLRELRAANVPVRNQDLVQRTGLPKATVSRLLNTLGTLGYVRRIDRGSYVLAHASARTGRAMLEGLGLHRYSRLFEGTPGTVCLELDIAGKLVPVYRWSGNSAGVVSNGVPATDYGLASASTQEGDGWDAEAGVWSTWTGLKLLPSVGSFVLRFQVSQPGRADGCQHEHVRGMLRRAAKAITSGEVA
jgi:DNA-binding transcriptional ArsR family regulator